MAKGYLPRRSTNLLRCFSEAKKHYMQTQDWYATREYLKVWIQANMGVSRPTIQDYRTTTEARVRADPEIRAMRRPAGTEEVPVD